MQPISGECVCIHRIVCIPNVAPTRNSYPRSWTQYWSRARAPLLIQPKIEIGIEDRPNPWKSSLMPNSLLSFDCAQYCLWSQTIHSQRGVPRSLASISRSSHFNSSFNSFNNLCFLNYSVCSIYIYVWTCCDRLFHPLGCANDGQSSHSHRTAPRHLHKTLTKMNIHETSARSRAIFKNFLRSRNLSAIIWIRKGILWLYMCVACNRARARA